MNERILELAKEHLRHEMYAAYGEIVEGDYYEFDPQELQDFVQSIVEDCIGVLSDKKFDHVPTTMNIAQTMIKQHFGVE
jgi:hypothetical protein